MDRFVWKERREPAEAAVIVVKLELRIVKLECSASMAPPRLKAVFIRKSSTNPQAELTFRYDYRRVLQGDCPSIKIRLGLVNRCRVANMLGVVWCEKRPPRCGTI